MRGEKMEVKRFTLRMEPNLFIRISKLAKLHRRSAAKEIEQAVAEYVMRERKERRDKWEDVYS